jgi:tetratricopeptide (TPR) repeat protein
MTLTEKGHNKSFHISSPNSLLRLLAQRSRLRFRQAWLCKLCRSKALALLVAGLLSCPAICAVQSNLTANEQIQMHLEQAQRDLSANAPELAVKEFRAVLKIDKGNATALANLGALAFVQGDCQAATSYFQTALRTAPMLSKAKGLLAICERRLGDPSAMLLLETSFRELQDNKIRAQVGIQLADAYYEKGDLEHTSTTIGALLQLDPNNADVLYIAQRVYQEMADDSLNKLAILEPKSARMQQVIAEHLINGGNVASAIQHYQAALKMDPKLLGVHFEIGESIMQVSIDDSALANAEKEFTAAIQSDGDSARVEVRLGMIAEMHSRFEDAYKYYKRAYTLNPNDLDAQMGIAKNLMDRGQPKDAIPYLRNVVDADPLNTETRYRLAVAYRKVGAKDEADKQMKLFRESRDLVNEVKNVYAQMNRQEKKRPDEIADHDKSSNVD